MSAAHLAGLARLQHQLNERAVDYFPELADRDFRVELVGASQRQYSHTYRFRIGSSATQRHVFVKVPTESSSAQKSGVASAFPARHRDRPRLNPVLPAGTEARLEYDGLKRMGECFTRRNDPRLQAPRVLDFLDDRAIVVEAIDFPTLSTSLNRAHRLQWRNRGTTLPSVFRSAGKWLRAFHEIPVRETSRPQLTTRNELLALVDELVTFLRQETGHKAYFDAVQARFVRSAEANLPQELPSVTTHGDFGPHNLFVTPDQGVVGFDTLAIWQSPPAKDVAYFLLLLETVPPLFVSRRVAIPADLLVACRRGFLESYTDGSEILRVSLHHFEIIVTLEKWVSAVYSCRQRRGVRAVAKNCRLVFQSWCLRTRVDHLLARLSCLDTA